MYFKQTEATLVNYFYYINKTLQTLNAEQTLSQKATGHKGFRTKKHLLRYKIENTKYIE